MRGSMRECSPVISKMRTMPVRGARTTEEKRAPIPATAKISGLVGDGGEECLGDEPEAETTEGSEDEERGKEFRRVPRIRRRRG